MDVTRQTPTYPAPRRPVSSPPTYHQPPGSRRQPDSAAQPNPVPLLCAATANHLQTFWRGCASNTRHGLSGVAPAPVNSGRARLLDTITWRSLGDKPDGTGGVIYAVQDGVQVEDIPAGWQGKVPWHRVASHIPKEH